MMLFWSLQSDSIGPSLQLHLDHRQPSTRCAHDRKKLHLQSTFVKHARCVIRACLVRALGHPVMLT